MSKKYYLGIDNGTSGTAAVLFDLNFKEVSKGYTEIHSYFPKAGYAEQDGNEIIDSILSSAYDAVRNANASFDEIISVGIANVGETVIAWDKNTGEPLYNAIVWHDTRTKDFCDSIKTKDTEYIKKVTGLSLDTYFSATKLHWLIVNVPEVKSALKNGNLCIGTLDSFIIFKLTGKKTFATDVSTASRTMLSDIHSFEWDDGLLQFFGLKKDVLPAILSSDSFFGNTDPDLFFGACIPINANIVDQQSSLFGHGCINRGEMKCTYGTGAFMLVNTGDAPLFSSALITTAAWKINGKTAYALDGGAYSCGAAINWLKNNLNIISSPKEIDIASATVKDNGGVYFVPAFSGLGAPYYDMSARGTVFGITGMTDKNHIIRATAEAIAYQVKDIFDEMTKTADICPASLSVDGGVTGSDFLMQFEADLLGIPIIKPSFTETTALGAAMISSLSSEISDFKNKDILTVSKTFYPKMSEDERASLLDMWHKAVEKSKNWV